MTDLLEEKDLLEYVDGTKTRASLPSVQLSTKSEAEFKPCIQTVKTANLDWDKNDKKALRTIRF